MHLYSVFIRGFEYVIFDIEQDIPLTLWKVV